MNKRLLLLLLVALLVCVPLARASYIKSIIYTKFNSASWTFYDLESEYTSLTVELYQGVTLNATTGEWLKLVLSNSSTTACSALILQFKNNTDLVVLYCDDNTLGVADVVLATGTWDTNNTKVTLSENLITVYDADGEVLIADFGYDTPVSHLVVCGGTDYATGGYMQVKCNVGVAGIGASIMEWMPMIIQFAMLGCVLGILKKFR